MTVVSGDGRVGQCAAHELECCRKTCSWLAAWLAVYGHSRVVPRAVAPTRLVQCMPCCLSAYLAFVPVQQDCGDHTDVQLPGQLLVLWAGAPQATGSGV